MLRDDHKHQKLIENKQFCVNILESLSQTKVTTLVVTPTYKLESFDNDF